MYIFRQKLRKRIWFFFSRGLPTCSQFIEISLFCKNSHIFHLKAVFQEKIVCGKIFKIVNRDSHLLQDSISFICTLFICNLLWYQVFDQTYHHFWLKNACHCRMPLSHLSNALIHTIFWESNWCRIRCWRFSVEILRHFEVKGNARELAAGRTVNLPPSAARINGRFRGTVVTPAGHLPGSGHARWYVITRCCICNLFYV